MNFFNLLLIFVPLTFWLEFTYTSDTLIFGAAIIVVLSFVIGKPMDLVLNNRLELVSLIGAVLICNSVARDGETSGLEGFMLLGVYLILGIAFFFLPSA